MKKIYILFAFLAAISCSHDNRQIPLSFDIDNQNSNIGAKNAVSIKVFDARSDIENNKFIGKKQYSSDDVVDIFSDLELSAIIKDKILQNLTNRGFTNGDAKLIEIYIQKFSYKTEFGFVLGNAKIESNLKLVITDKQTRSKFTKNYVTNLTKKHFLLSLDKADQEAVNSVLKSVIQEIISDDNFIENLIK